MAIMAGAVNQYKLLVNVLCFPGSSMVERLAVRRQLLMETSR